MVVMWSVLDFSWRIIRESQFLLVVVASRASPRSVSLQRGRELVLSLTQNKRSVVRCSSWLALCGTFNYHRVFPSSASSCCPSRGFTAAAQTCMDRKGHHLGQCVHLPPPLHLTERVNFMETFYQHDKRNRNKKCTGSHTPLCLKRKKNPLTGVM